jgi:RNA polymerase sigma-70 factor, ECF subfamily
MGLVSSDVAIRFPPWKTDAVDELTVLALRAKGGSRPALERFVSETRPDVLKLVRYLGRPADPDDLVQETYERALRTLHLYRGDGPARAWLFSIARRVCIDAGRRSSRRRRLADRLTSQMPPDIHLDAAWIEVEESLAILDADRREAFVLTQFLGLSYEEAAVTIGCPIGTVRSRVARARMQLLDDPALIDRRRA